MPNDKPDWHSARISGTWVVFPKRLSATKAMPKGIIYHREANDENLEMTRDKWLGLPIYYVRSAYHASR